MIFALILLGEFFASRTGVANQGWILLLISTSIIILFFAIGFYWIFQTVEISDEGIKTKLFKKQLKSIHWNNIERVTYGSVKRNPTYTIVSKDGCEINLGTRKAIRQLFIFYSNNYNFVFNDRK